MELSGVTITHPEKVLYPAAKITKAEVAEYYNFISSYILPYIKKRPLSLRQYPENIDRPGFFHKHAAKHYPSYIKRFIIPTSHHGEIEMVGVSSAEGLVYLAGQNTIELHMALSHVRSIKKPDQIILDLDPSDDDFKKVREVALVTKDILDQHNFVSYVKTTGSRGLHIHIPIKPSKEYDAVKQIALQLAEQIRKECPEIATMQYRKNKRENKVFIDYLRNDYSATAIAPYSLRANKWAGIATPLHWHEVTDNNKLNGYTFNIKNIRRRLDEIDDPWYDF